MKKGKVIQLLSPENYIRQKARALPIRECWINAGWEEMKLANVIVSRKHSNGNLTVGFFLVDLLCTGVKDTYYSFNMPDFEYADLLKKASEREDLEKIDYTLVHNIIYAGIEFAEDYGFKPCKGFDLVKFILEEDNDSIELIDIECGHNGQPTVIERPDNRSEVKKAIAVLEKTAGQGNYYVIQGTEWDEDSLMSDDTDNEEPDIARIKDLFKRSHELSNEERAELIALSDNIFTDYLDMDMVEELGEKLSRELDALEFDRDYYDGLLGTRFDDPETAKKIFSKATEVLDVLLEKENTDKARKKLKSFKSKYGELPIAVRIGMQILEVEGKDESFYLLEEAVKQHPEYKLLKVYYLSRLASLGEIHESKIHYLDELNISYLFNGQQKFHPIEIYEYLLLRFNLAAAQNDLEMIQALRLLVEQLAPVDDSFMILLSFIIALRMSFLKEELSGE